MGQLQGIQTSYMAIGFPQREHSKRQEVDSACFLKFVQ